MDRQDQEEVQVSLAATDFFIFWPRGSKASLWAGRRWLRVVRDRGSASQQLRGNPCTGGKPLSARSLAELSGCSSHGDGAHGGAMWPGVLLACKEAGRLASGRVRGGKGLSGTWLPPVSLGKPLPLALPVRQGQCFPTRCQLCLQRLCWPGAVTGVAPFPLRPEAQDRGPHPTLTERRKYSSWTCWQPETKGMQQNCQAWSSGCFHLVWSLLGVSYPGLD